LGFLTTSETTLARSIRLIVLPYDSGRKHERLGKGPDAFLAAGVVEALRSKGHAVEITRIEVDRVFPLEVTMAFELAALLSQNVQKATATGEFTLVLAGNCFSSVGTLSGLRRDEIGVAWFDCHGDFHTPETTPSGFLDGMALAAVCGKGWSTLATSVPWFRPVAPDRIVHLAGRDFDPGEKEAMVAAGIRVYGPPALLQSTQQVSFTDRQGSPLPVYLHFDLDTLDPSEGRVNTYQTPHGLSTDAAAALLQEIAKHHPVAAAAVTAYEPDGDADGRALHAGLRLIYSLAEIGSRQSLNR
jgi:arginase